MLGGVEHRTAHVRQPVSAIKNQRNRDPFIERTDARSAGVAVGLGQHPESLDDVPRRAGDRFVGVDRHAQSIARLRAITYFITLYYRLTLVMLKMTLHRLKSRRLGARESDAGVAVLSKTKKPERPMALCFFTQC